MSMRLLVSLRLRIFLTFFCYLAAAWSQQSQHVLQGDFESTRLLDGSIALNFSSTAPHIFSSLHSLLQQWPNTYFPNGHSIVPCEVPAYTVVYHGRPSDDLPDSPDFISFDIEMSYAIMGNTRNSHILTYQATRPVKCLYFDGQSAALMGSGPMDAQMVFLYGNTTGPEARGPGILGDEYARARDLCKWAFENDLGGSGWGIEGIVRMNAGFEMMWCNFSSPSLKLINRLNVSAPLLPEKRNVSRAFDVQMDEASDNAPDSLFPMPTTTASEASPTASGPPTFSLPPDWQDMQLREPFLFASGWEWFRSTTWQYGDSGMGRGKGESRIKPLLCGFLTYYDPTFLTRATAISALEQSYLNLTGDGEWKGEGSNGTREIALKQLSVRRRHHTLQAMENANAILMNDKAKLALSNLNQTLPECTGMDWISLTDEIIQRYSKPLVELSTFLSTFDQSSNISETETFVRAARIRTHALLLPYLSYPSNIDTAPPEQLKKILAPSSPLADETFSHCKYRYTRLLHPAPSNLSPSESLLLSSIEEVMSSICSSIITVGLSVELFYFTHFHHPNSKHHHIQTSLADLTPTWTSNLDLLLAYLGWLPSLTTCSQPCAWDEICHIPIWPLSGNFAPAPAYPPGSSSDVIIPPGPPGRGRGNFPGGPPGDGHGGGGRGPPGGHNRTRPGPPGDRHPPDHDGPPWGRRRNRTIGYGGMDNLPPMIGGFPWFGDQERGLWEPRCIKVQDMRRWPL